MTVNLLTVAGFTGLGLFLLAAVWYWHAQYQAQRIRAEQSDDWSDYWQHWSEEWRGRAERATAAGLQPAAVFVPRLRVEFQTVAFGRRSRGR